MAMVGDALDVPSPHAVAVDELFKAATSRGWRRAALPVGGRGEGKGRGRGRRRLGARRGRREERATEAGTGVLSRSETTAVCS